MARLDCQYRCTRECSLRFRINYHMARGLIELGGFLIIFWGFCFPLSEELFCNTPRSAKVAGPRLEFNAISNHFQNLLAVSVTRRPTCISVFEQVNSQLLNIGSIRIYILMTGRNVEQTKMYVCTFVEFILVEIWIHCCTKLN